MSLSSGAPALLARLAVGLDELVRPELSGPTLAAALVDLGALAFDLADLGPSPDGATLVVAGLDRWEELDPDEWDDESESVVDAARRKRPQWRKSVFPRRPDLAERLEVLGRSLDERRRDGWATLESVRSEMSFLASVGAPAPAGAPMVGRARAGGKADATERATAVDVGFDADLDGRVIGAERLDHHLVVHLGGLPDDDLWLRVHEAGPVPRLLATAPVGAPERTWRTAVALIGPDVADHDLLVDVTRRPREPFRSPSVRRTEHATHLGRVAARASRLVRDDDDLVSARGAWLRCAEAWGVAGDVVRSVRAQHHADQPPAPRWATTDPLVTDEAFRP